MLCFSWVSLEQQLALTGRAPHGTESFGGRSVSKENRRRKKMTFPLALATLIILAAIIAAARQSRLRRAENGPTQLGLEKQPTSFDAHS